MNDRQRHLAALRSGYQTNLRYEQQAMATYERTQRESALNSARIHGECAAVKLQRIAELEAQEGEAK